MNSMVTQSSYDSLPTKWMTIKCARDFSVADDFFHFFRRGVRRVEWRACWRKFVSTHFSCLTALFTARLTTQNGIFTTCAAWCWSIYWSGKKVQHGFIFRKRKHFCVCFSWWCLKLCWTSLLVPRFSLPNFPETSKLPLQHSVWSSIFHPLFHRLPAFLIHIFVSSIKRFAQRFRTSVCLFELIEKKWDQHIK